MQKIPLRFEILFGNCFLLLGLAFLTILLTLEMQKVPNIRWTGFEPLQAEERV